MLIPPPSCHEGTMNSGSGLEENPKLQESDFPMTLLIKERTMNYIVGHYSEEGSSSDDQDKGRCQDKYSIELGERYKYFR